MCTIDPRENSESTRSQLGPGARECINPVLTLSGYGNSQKSRYSDSSARRHPHTTISPPFIAPQRFNACTSSLWFSMPVVRWSVSIVLYCRRVAIVVFPLPGVPTTTTSRSNRTPFFAFGSKKVKSGAGVTTDKNASSHLPEVLSCSLLKRIAHSECLWRRRNSGLIECIPFAASPAVSAQSKGRELFGVL